LSERPETESASQGGVVRPVGVTVLTALFYVATVSSFAAALSLLEPGSALDAIWGLNPAVREGLLELGGRATALLFGSSVACAAAAAGLWIRQPWGRRVAILVLVLVMMGEFANVFFQGDALALVGLPIAGIVTAYLMSDRAKRGEPIRKS
jgi:hypothetical protein